MTPLLLAPDPEPSKVALVSFEETGLPYEMCRSIGPRVQQHKRPCRSINPNGKCRRSSIPTAGRATTRGPSTNSTAILL